MSTPQEGKPSLLSSSLMWIPGQPQEQLGEARTAVSSLGCGEEMAQATKSLSIIKPQSSKSQRELPKSKISLQGCKVLICIQETNPCLECGEAANLSSSQSTWNQQACSGINRSPPRPKIAPIPKHHRQNPGQEAPESAAFSNCFHSDRFTLQRNLTNSPGRK